MDSPFPGMDPYLERHRVPVHTQVVGGASRLLNRLVPKGLVARPEERAAVHADESDGDEVEIRGYRPDVRVAQRPGARSGIGALLLDAPFTLFVDLEPATERFVRILTTHDDRLVTVIEFLSPANKAGRGLQRYLDKRADLIDGGVNVVEVDLVRRGDWQAVLDPHVCPANAVAEYRATVRLGGDPGRAFLYPLPLRQPMPPVPIPLRPTDDPIPLDVQRLIRETYADDLYGDTLHYAAECSPPLAPDDAAWADALLRAAGRR